VADEPDSTAVRVALWRAMHVQADPEPHLLEDEIGLRLVPDDTASGPAAARRSWSPAPRAPGRVR
jgi:O-methyltransferase involved in polyketide biosynthesis